MCHRKIFVVLTTDRSDVFAASNINFRCAHWWDTNDFLIDLIGSKPQFETVW